MKSIKTVDATDILQGNAADFAVLEVPTDPQSLTMLYFQLDLAVEYTQVTRAICLADSYDENDRRTLFGLHFGNRSNVSSLESRPIYVDDLYRASRDDCK